MVPFAEDTPEALIRAIRPDILAKGADYALEDIVGHDIVPEYGGRVERIPLTAGRATTRIIEEILQRYAPES